MTENKFVVGADVLLCVGHTWLRRRVARVYKNGRFILDGDTRMLGRHQQFAALQNAPDEARLCGSYSSTKLRLATPENIRIAEEHDARVNMIRRRKDALYEIEKFVFRFRHHPEDLDEELANRLETLAQELVNVTRRPQS